jgi:uncharacterized membrane protein YkvA (DUF1232 family)
MNETKKQPGRFFEQWKMRVKKLKSETYALYLAIRDPRTPWYAKAFTSLVVAYAFSPIDLVPDFIPVLGYLDDLILIPLGIALSVRMIPYTVLEECRTQAQTAFESGKPVSRGTAVGIVLIWLLLAALVIKWVWQLSI